MKISKVVYNPEIGRNIARVNRKTGVLELDPAIWEALPELERDFVLLHEYGHVELQTASEFAANQYAIKEFLPVRTLTNKELGQRIEVLTRITAPDNYISYYSGVDPVGAIGEAVGKIFETLPLIGLGSKSRKEAADNNAANAWISQSISAKNSEKLLIVGGIFLLGIVVVIMIFKSSK
ncbi:hypothetical protein JZU46_01130 [bacterium]|nr:hypothetical protein [bacterium]